MEFKIPAYKYQKIRNLYAELKKNSIPWNKGKRNIFSKEKLQEMVKHHKDFNYLNNTKDNFIPLTKNQHRLEHEKNNRCVFHNFY